MGLLAAGRRHIGDILGWLIVLPPILLQILHGILKAEGGVLAETLQIRQHFVGGGVAAVAVSGHGLHADLLQCLRDVGIDLPGAEGHGGEVLDGNRHRIVSVEGQAAGEHLVEHHAGGVDIAAVVGVVPLGLLRGDIVGGADGLVGGMGAVGEAGDAEVRYLHCPIPEDHDVLGLDIPVDDAPAVGVAEPLHDLSDEMEGLRPVQPAPPLHILLKGNTVNELHDDIVHIPAAAHVVDSDNVGVGEHGDSLGLVVEPAAELRVIAEILLQHFDGDQAVEPVALGFKHHRHPPGTDYLQDLVAVVKHLSYVSFHSQVSFLPCGRLTAAAAALR